MDPKRLELLVRKPPLVIRFPQWMLPPTTVEAMKNTNSAMVEIAGRDSFAAAIAAAKEGFFETLLPAIAYTGTEYGDWETTFEKCQWLKGRLEHQGIRVFDPVLLGDPQLWHMLCGRPLATLFETYGFYTPCINCHLYFHVIRIPLAKMLNCSVLISGERESHNGRVKVNQIAPLLDAFKEFMSRFNIDLLQPIRHISSGHEIERLLEHEWQEGKDQLQCVLSGNYAGLDGQVVFHEETISRLLSEFSLPQAERLLKERYGIEPA